MLSDWRALVLWRRATLDLKRIERRWEDLPAEIADVNPVLRRMQERGDIKALPHLQDLYEVTIPYAPTGHIEESEILLEANPYAALSHITAMVFHGLTDDLPHNLVASIPERDNAGLLPPNTTSQDWDGLPFPIARTPATVRRVPVRWVRLSRKKHFGTQLYQPRTYSVRVTTPERTLLDGLQQPDLCGGFDNVLKAWARAADTVNLAELLDYTDLYDVGVLRQRVGFILEELGIQHSTLQEWRDNAKRGGSSRLVGSLPFSSAHSERWSLSINAPIDALHHGSTDSSKS